MTAIWSSGFMNDILSGLRILILEDESLIALDVEQLCRDHGASDIIIKRDLKGLESENALDGFDVAIVDLMLSGVSALPFAERLRNLNRPFLFTTGLADIEVTRAFPGIQAIGKPYAGAELVQAIAAAAGRL
jgi:DNA-binding response OmpR family regulator